MENTIDTLKVRFIPDQQDNNTLLMCTASDLPGTMTSVQSFLRVLPMMMTTEPDIYTTDADTTLNEVDLQTITPIPATDHFQMIMIIVIIVASVIILLCICIIAGMFARRRRGYERSVEKNGIKTDIPVELVESTVYLSEIDKKTPENSFHDIAGYAEPISCTPEGSPRISAPPVPLPLARRSSLPEHVFHSYDLSGRERKQSEPFVVYAKPDKPKLRKWASQGASAFTASDSKKSESSSLYQEVADPPPVYAKPSKSTNSLHSLKTPDTFPHYAKPNKKKERKYLSQKPAKPSNAPLSKPRKWMSLSKDTR